MGEAVVTVDAHGTIVLFNRAAEQLFGYAAEDVLGQPLGVLLPEASRASHAEHMRRFAQSGDSRQMMEGRPEIQGLRRDGSTFHAAAAVTKTWQGGSIFYTAVLRDVTERRRARQVIEERNRVLAALAQAQVNFITGMRVTDVFSGMLDLLLDVTDSEYGFIAEVLMTADGEPYLLAHAINQMNWDADTARFYRDKWQSGIEFHDLDSLYGEIVTTNEVVLANTPPVDSRSTGVPRGHPPLNAFLGVPIRRGGVVIGAIGLANRPGGYDSEMLPGLRPIASTLAALIEAYRSGNERRRTLEALQRSERYSRALFEHATVGLMLVSLDLTVIDANRAVELLLGYDAGALNGQRLAALTPSRYHAMDRMQFGQACRTGVLDGYEKHLLHRDGDPVPVRLHGRLIDDDGEQLLVLEVENLTPEIRARRTEQNLAKAQRIAKLGTWEWHIGSGEFWLSDEAMRTLGRTAAEDIASIDAFVALVHPDDQPGFRAAIEQTLLHDDDLRLTHRVVQPDGGVRVVIQQAEIEYDISGAPVRMTGTMLDNTAQAQVEEQLRQAQKMEAVGQLTGGIAHDFNNILAVMIGNLDLMSEHVADPMARDMLEKCISAGERGASLVRGLLAFARQQPLRPETIDINALVATMATLLARVLGETIDIVLRPAETPCRSQVDGAMLESAIINMAINARDAMPDGGTLTLATSELTVGADVLDDSGADLAPGHYVCLAITDTGVGMSEAVRRRVFEPFFTTKGLGKGTGLGLSMVYGFAKQSGGTVRVASQPGRGTTITLVLPALDGGNADTPVDSGAATAAQMTARNRGCVLLVEDNADIRAVNTALLRQFGFEVIDVPDAGSALDILRGEQDVVLLFSDVVLKDSASGVQLAQEARAVRPALKILLTSGHERPATAGPDSDVGFLPKPYRAAELETAIRRMVAGEAPADG